MWTSHSCAFPITYCAWASTPSEQRRACHQVQLQVEIVKVEMLKISRSCVDVKWRKNVLKHVVRWIAMMNPDWTIIWNLHLFSGLQRLTFVIWKNLKYLSFCELSYFSVLVQNADQHRQIHCQRTRCQEDHARKVNVAVVLKGGGYKHSWMQVQTM